jgi:hypothetical protein
MKKTTEHFETQERNARYTQYQPDKVFGPMRKALEFAEEAHRTKQSIAADRRLTPEGKRAARAKLVSETIEKIRTWDTDRLTGIDDDIAAQRAALLVTTRKPETKQVEFLAGKLSAFSPQDIVVLYEQASDDLRLEMEAASVSLGPIPVKSANGMGWQTLLSPEVITEAVLSRAAKVNPAGAAKLRELEEIRETQHRISTIAIREIEEAP